MQSRPMAPSNSTSPRGSASGGPPSRPGPSSRPGASPLRASGGSPSRSDSKQGGPPSAPSSRKSSRPSTRNDARDEEGPNPKRDRCAWCVPIEKKHNLTKRDQIKALNYVLFVAVPYCFILCIFYIVHYAIKKNGPARPMVTGIQSSQEMPQGVLII